MSGLSALFAQENAQKRVVSTWTESASAENDATTATKEGVPTRSHFVSGITAGFTGGSPAAPILASLQLGEYGEPLTFGVTTAGLVVTFDPPLEVPVGEDATLTLAAGGSSIVGRANLIGLSV